MEDTNRSARRYHGQELKRTVLDECRAGASDASVAMAQLKAKYGLVLGDNICYIDASRFVHHHNKMIVVDGATVLVSSQSWSDAAVTKNREAGLLLTRKGIAKYFTGIFENDWENAFKKIPVPSRPQVDPEALRAGGFVQVVPADYREV